MIFKGVQEGRPYPELTLPAREWAQIPPRQFRLDQLITVTTVLALDKLLSEDSTFYGDLFAHVVQYRGELYLEDGLHRAVRSALRNRTIIHARLLDLDELIATGRFDPNARMPAPVSGPFTGPQPIDLNATGQLPPVGAPLDPSAAATGLAPRPANPRRSARRGSGAHRAID
ncbi:type II toxin-antitoxin system VapB family antitoxin [Gordonia sp. PP30]|uniref:type II toxin-antitoxin system VapB family antitoxin n=1 Tax=Gordonia sp. PP30 TaxID=2935861 RepID=UPI001FFED61D|nr:type II toxin-antitoxin system VapB family antitoxin [Gordonia sp. PP30]UQE73791.1 type II toxin-antitoxin system VapB family antitoxin [Gordonia sp. PP30]